MIHSPRSPLVLPKSQVLRLVSALIIASLFLASCQVMYEQPRYDPLEASEFFPDGRSARLLTAGTVPFQEEGLTGSEQTGRDENGEYLVDLPVELTPELLLRGQEMYNVNCSPCHGLDGNGQGVVVTFGFPAPPSLHTEALYQAPMGYYYDVITHGTGLMFAYGYRVKPADRWAVSAYIRALQLSQNATGEYLTPEDQQQLENQP